jgi:hypothetical protein
VQNRNRGANNDNLTASAGPITSAAETTLGWLIVLTRKGLFT